MSSNTLRWTLVTSIGLGAGIAAGLVLQRPIEAVLGMVLVTPAVTALVGALLGASQWFEVRRHLAQPHRWLPATAIGLGIGLTAGVVAVEVLGQLILGRPLRLLSLQPAAQSLNMFCVGAIAGGTLGIAQRLWIRSLPSQWPLFSALGLGLGLSLGAALANASTGAMSSPIGLALVIITTGITLGLSTRRIGRTSAA